MKFKIDENLPAEYKRSSNKQPFKPKRLPMKICLEDTIPLSWNGRIESRILMTLDLDFGNIQAYPPARFAGIVVFRSKAQDKATLTKLLELVLPALSERSPEHRLWIVEHDRIRIRE